MSSTITSAVFFLFCNFVAKCHGLDKIPKEKDDTILLTESVIRDTTNKLFATISGKGLKTSPKIRQYLVIHNFFTSVSLRDNKLHNAIAKVSRVDRNEINNETWNFIDIINRLLNEDSKDEDVASDDEHVVVYVNRFLKNFEEFKQDDVLESRNINDAILKILQDNNVDNVNRSNTDTEGKGLNENVFWVPEPQTRRIYKGQRTKVKHFPFMASIHVFNNFQCGGSIIKADLVLSAASCLQLAWNNRFYRENPAFLSVRVGSNFYTGGGESIAVMEVYFHPEYNPKNLRNNICVLRLLRQLKFAKNKRKVKMIDIDRAASALPMTTPGITIVGWGAKGSGNMISSPWNNQLAYAVLDVYHLRECQEIYSREYVTRTNFCAGFISKGGGACNHDVGGPGVVSGYLAGVVSFGSPVCGAPDAPTVFTKVGYYADWIDDIMDQEVPYMEKRTTTTAGPLSYEPIQVHTYEKTTFKIPPLLDAKLTPPPFDPEALRIDDQNLFKDFLSTMFNSKEAQEYKLLLEDNMAVGKAQESNEIPKTSGEGSDGFNYDRVTKLEPFVVKKSNKPKLNGSGIDDMNMAGDDIDNKIVQLIDNTKTDIEEFDQEIRNPKKPRKHKDRKQRQEMEDSADKPKKHKSKKKEDEVLTLLYFSDDEKDKKLDDIGNIIEDFDENFSEGLTISMDGFRDLTFRQNDSDPFLDFFSKDELYDILNEAIDDAKNNKEI